MWTDDVGAVSWWAHRVTCKNYAWKTTAREKSDWHGRFTPNAKLLLLPINANRKGHLVYYQYYNQSASMFKKWKISAINNMYIICTIISQRLNPKLGRKNLVQATGSFVATLEKFQSLLILVFEAPQSILNYNFFRIFSHSWL